MEPREYYEFAGKIQANVEMVEEGHIDIDQAWSRVVKHVTEMKEKCEKEKQS